MNTQIEDAQRIPDNPIRMKLPSALSGQRVEFDSPAGRLSMYQCGTGDPLLLIHSVNAAASAAEVRPLFDRYCARRAAFALDLPGFGFSERSDRPYTVRLMTDAVHAAVAYIQDTYGVQPVDALSLSLSCEFLARAAAESNRFRSLAFVSPTGLQRPPANCHRPQGLGSHASWKHTLLTAPGWGRWLYNMLTLPPVIRYFLKRTWGSSHIDEQLWRYDVLTSRQPGAEHAPLHFVAGDLFSDDALHLYEQITVPVWMSNGCRGDFSSYPYAGHLETQEHWRHTEFRTGALPFFEEFRTFCAQYDAFLELVGHETRSRATSQQSSTDLPRH